MAGRWELTDEQWRMVEPVLREARVIEALATLNCTRVIIAQRLSTVAGADRSFVMNGGRIVESGKHHALVALAGHYANMYIDQLGRDNL
jgi:ABC-type multidrug transport system fused ATPase/permease subunit